MPRIKRWFPVSHDINADPEVWAMRRTIGEKSLSIWLEILSIADRNDSELPGDYQELIRSVSGKCQSTVRLVCNVFEYAQTKLWLVYDPTLRVAKYSKYHISRDANKIPLGNSIASPPSEPSLPTEPIEEDTNTYEVLVSPARQEKIVSPVAQWPDDGLWLKEFIERQTIAPSKHLLEPVWWKDVATSSGGIDLEFLETEFARMSAWLNENASRAPASRAGWKKFIRHWLERAHEKERKNNHVQLQKPKQYGYARH